MDVLIPLLIALFIILGLVTVVGHIIWLTIGWFFQEVTGTRKPPTSPTILAQDSHRHPQRRTCPNCEVTSDDWKKFCGVCGARRLTEVQDKELRELEATLRQLAKLHQSGVLDEANFRALKTEIENQREELLFPDGRPGTVKQASLFTPQTEVPTRRSVVMAATDAGAAPPLRPSVTEASEGRTQQESGPPLGGWTADSDQARASEPIPKPPRKPFAEVLAAFMEQSNIRWGEIIGGVLIIGCSTALVISLWAQISRVPVLKFLIFTTVTAALFAVGFYTEHRWKLPTTSRGILTIATLLVPLNFLAIAAVSTNTAPQGALVIGSEIIAPAVFLCLVYFAGRVITPAWPHLLAAGALGSSVGQLLIRHFAEPDNSGTVLIALGAFPVLCYVGANAWMFILALADGELDEPKANGIFTALGALTFALVLPFGLLLFKSQSAGMAMMQLAPLVTLAATPLLAGGMLVWQRVLRKDLVATRTAGASIAILGMAVALGGMVMAWPNPAGLIPAALFNFALFTAVAIFLDEPRAHVFAASCLTLVYVIAFHVLAGHVTWENLRVVSLLRITARASTGQVLAIPFIAFVFVSEWLFRKEKANEAFSYLVAACGAAVVSLLFLIAFGIRIDGDPHYLSAILMLYASGAFWFAWREKLTGFAWAGAALLFFASAQFCHSLWSMRFPWQASCLLFAGLCVAGALGLRKLRGGEVGRSLVQPLQKSAMAGAVAAALFLLVQLIWNGCEPASLFAARAFMLAAVLLGLLILDRSAIVFNSFQIGLTLSAILATKSFLQRYDWYEYKPAAWLHPWGLQLQGIVLGLICSIWLAIRMLMRRRTSSAVDDSETERHWTRRIILDLPMAFDHVLAGALVVAFVTLLVFGAASGISKELTNAARTPLVANLAGFPHELIFGVGSLIVLAILLGLMFGNLHERQRKVFTVGGMLVLWAVCPLLAGRFESQFATASASRWSVAIFLLLISAAYAFGKKFSLTESRLNFVSMRVALLILTIVPLVLLTLSPVIDDINYVPARGPQAGIFRAMGGVVLYGVPLIFGAVALGIHAVRQRSAAFAFAGGLLVNFTVTTVYIVSVARLSGLMTRAVLVDALQLNTIAAAAFALMWMSTRQWWMSPDVSTGSFPDLSNGEGSPQGRELLLLTFQQWIAITLAALFIVPIALHLIAFPDRVGVATVSAASLNGWIALLLTIAVAVLFHKVVRKPLRVAVLAAALVGAGFLAAFGAARFAVANWAALHVLLGGLVLISWVLLLMRNLPKLLLNEKPIGLLWSRVGLILSGDWEKDSLLFASVAGATAALVALRGPFSDPIGAWWSIGVLLTMSALAASLNWVTLKRSYLYAAGILFNLAVSIWLIKYQSQPVSSLTSFVEANVVALSLTSVIWLLLELRARQLKAKSGGGTGVPPVSHAQDAPATFNVTSFHNVAALASLLAMSSVIAVRLYSDLYGFYQTPAPLLDWTALASLAALMFACLWDREAGYAVAGLYVLGLIKAATVLHHFDLTPGHLAWALTIAGAFHAFAAALIWRVRAPVMGWASRLKIPLRIDSTVNELKWLNIFNSLVVAAIVGLAFWIDLTFYEWRLRATASLAVGLQTLTFGLMARGRLRVKWQRAAVTMFLLGMVFCGWSSLTPGSTGTWLNRAVILMALMFATVAVFGAGLDRLFKREPVWTKAIRDCVPAMTIIGIVSLGFVLCTEVYYQIEFGAVRVRLLALLTVALALAAAVIVCIFFAVSPRHDPLTLSESLRGAYVYAAEVMLVLLFMHIRLTMPWLFHGFFQRYWPLVVLAIAYAGVTVSEFLKRKRVRVLAQPIERTGAFLPLLPVIGFWIAQSQVEYSTLLFVVGGLYGLLSILRSSFWFGLAAGLAGNGGLWYLLHETSEYHFLQHPQLWLIPAAVSVLIAAHLNRKDFSEAQMSGIRYLCLVAIYVSSTADIFLNGVARSPWLPLVLAGLSIAGVFAGMIFRIRAFLLLGSVFLLLAIATMINYASVNFGWTWLWYVAGIVTGIAIITMFAVFEKKRAEVLRVVDELKDWKA